MTSWQNSYKYSSLGLGLNPIARNRWGTLHSSLAIRFTAIVRWFHQLWPWFHFLCTGDTNEHVFFIVTCSNAKLQSCLIKHFFLLGFGCSTTSVCFMIFSVQCLVDSARLKRVSRWASSSVFSACPNFSSVNYMDCKQFVDCSNTWYISNAVCILKCTHYIWHFTSRLFNVHTYSCGLKTKT